MDNNIISKILNNINKNEEFEILYNVSNKSNSFNNIKVLNDTIKKQFKSKSKKHILLDIIYNNYRITVESLNHINSIYKFLQNNYSNKDILNHILTLDNITICKKKNIIKEYIKEIDSKYKLSSEEIIDNNVLIDYLKHNIHKNENIILLFRYKERISFSLYKNKNYSITLDLSITKQNNILNKLMSQNQEFEIELEAFSFTKNNNIDSKKFIKFHNFILKQIFFNQNVFNKYCELLNTNNFYTMNPISLNKQIYEDKIPYYYSVTDKADGEKYQLFIFEQNIYLININNDITHYGKTKLKDFYIAEAEKIQDRILLYDILYFKNKDIRNESLKVRLDCLNKFISAINSNKNFKFDINNLDKNMNSYVKFINSKNKLIEQKYIILPTGLEGKNEVYNYADKIWNTFKNMPYQLDGIIFNHINQPYQKSFHLQTNPIYKWKPSELNSIDFYIKFTSDDLISIDDTLFKTIQIYNYDKNQIIPFKKKDNLHIAYIEIYDNNLVDTENNIVKDNTIVEMIYIKDKRWKILRTRHDKTNYMLKYNTKFGNHIKVAQDIFEIINNPFDLTFTQTKKYYEKKTSLGKEMREFHNKIKNFLIQKYTPKKNVLDIGIGKGGDIHKYYHAKVKSLVGVEPSAYDLFHASDSAVQRYTNLKKKEVDNSVPKFIFIQTDFGLPLTVSKQTSIDKQNKENNDNIKDFLKKNKKYNVINFSFSFHYLYVDKYKEQLFKNINDKLAKKGFLIITIFDGDKINQFLNDKQQQNVYHSDNKIFFSIKRISNSEIELYNSIYNQDNTFYSEPIVFYKTLQKELKDFCGLKLVETKLFEDYLDENKSEFQNLLTNNSPEVQASLKLSKLYRYYVFTN